MYINPNKLFRVVYPDRPSEDYETVEKLCDYLCLDQPMDEINIDMMLVGDWLYIDNGTKSVHRLA